MKQPTVSQMIAQLTEAGTTSPEALATLTISQLSQAHREAFPDQFKEKAMTKTPRTPKTPGEARPASVGVSTKRLHHLLDQVLDTSHDAEWRLMRLGNVGYNTGQRHGPDSPECLQARELSKPIRKAMRAGDEKEVKRLVKEARTFVDSLPEPTPRAKAEKAVATPAPEAAPAMEAAVDEERRAEKAANRKAARIAKAAALVAELSGKENLSSSEIAQLAEAKFTVEQAAPTADAGPLAATVNPVPKPAGKGKKAKVAVTA